MKRLFVLVLVICGISTFSVAQAEYWQLSRHGKTYTVDFDKHGDRLSGRYIGINNDSVFEGNFYSGRGVYLINFTQIDDNGFYAVHSGMKQGNQYSGYWYSTSGDSGRFVLSR